VVIGSAELAPPGPEQCVEHFIGEGPLQAHQPRLPNNL
jgi:hypothetical protein